MAFKTGNQPALPDETTAKGRKAKGKALATMADIGKLYAVEATEAVAAAPAGDGVKRISTKDGVFWMGEQDLPDPLNVVVVADAHLNVWYDTDYDPANPQPPACFALAPAKQLDAEGRAKPGTGEEAMHAHSTSPRIQGGKNEHDCATCPKNQFGSAEVGRGKACANSRQLAVVMADDPGLSGDGEPTYAILGLSATALGPWGKYVAGLAKIESRPPHGAVTRFTFDKKNPDERRRKAVIATGYQLITDVRVATKVNQLRKEIIGNGVLLRPLPIEVRDKKQKAKASTPQKAKATSRPVRF